MPAETVRRSSGPSGAMELLHTMALVHDDVLDGTTERRGAPTTVPWMSQRAPSLAPGIDPGRFGLAAAILVGDLAAVLADRLLLESGFEPEALARALAVYHHMRIDMAAGQFLDVAGRGDDPARTRAIARLKGGAYTVEGPLLVGAAFAVGKPRCRRRCAGTAGLWVRRSSSPTIFGTMRLDPAWMATR